MGISQLFDHVGDALDLWLSPNHEGQRRDAAQKRDVWAHMLRAIPLFSGLEEHERVAICSVMSHRYFLNGDVVVHKGQDLDCMYMVEEGELECLAIEDDKPPIVVKTLTKGNTLGEFSLMAAPTADMSADLQVRAAGQVGVAVLSRQTLIKMLDHAVGTREKLQKEHGIVTGKEEMAGTGVVSISGAGSVAAEGKKRVLELPDVTPGAIKYGHDASAPQGKKKKQALFSSTFGAPTVFLGKPEGRVICPQCQDVFLDPVVSSSGITYCRKCVPTGDELVDIADLGTDDVVWNHILRMHIVCRHGLVLKETGGLEGAKSWQFDRDGCTKYIKFQDRDLHEMTCDYEFVRCTLPNSGNHLENCGQLVRGFQLKQHEADCMHRLVPCKYKGCDAMVQHRKLADHEGLCYNKPMDCPYKCKWEGTRRELIQHRTVCPKQVITCGRESTEDSGKSCPYQLERRLMEAHDTVCEFRLVPCEWCSTQVSYIHMGEHLEHCPDRKKLCQQCGQSVHVRRWEEHEARFCGKVKVACDFAKYGCSERLTREEMMYHMHDNAPQHLRLLMLAVDHVSTEYGGWYGRVDEIKLDIQAHVRQSSGVLEGHAREIREIREAGEAEVEELKRELVDLQVGYEREVAGLRAAVHDIRRADDAKLAEMEVENAALRVMLEACLTRDEAEVTTRSMDELRGRITEEAAATAEAVDAHQRAWERDLAEVKASADGARKECEDRLTEVQKVVAEGQISTTEKQNALYDEIGRVTTQIQRDMEGARERQTSLEKSVQEVNEQLRPLSQGGVAGGGGALRSLGAASKFMKLKGGGSRQGAPSTSGQSGKSSSSNAQPRFSSLMGQLQKKPGSSAANSAAGGVTGSTAPEALGGKWLKSVGRGGGSGKKYQVDGRGGGGAGDE